MQVFQLPAPEGDGLWVGHSGVRFTPDGRYLYVPANTRNFLDTLREQRPGVLLHRVFGFAGDGTLSVACYSPTEGNIVVTNIRTRKRDAHEQKAGCNHRGHEAIGSGCAGHSGVSEKTG